MRKCNTDYGEKNSFIDFKKETLNEDTHFLKFYSNDYLQAMLNLENCNNCVKKDKFAFTTKADLPFLAIIKNHNHKKSLPTKLHTSTFKIP